MRKQDFLRFRGRQARDIPQLLVNLPRAHADEFIELVAGLGDALLGFREDVAEFFKFRLDGREHIPDLARALLDGERLEAELEAV